MQLAPAILERMTDVAVGDARILAVVQCGSAATGEVDEWSDLDLVLLCTDDGHASLLAGSVELADRLGPLLTSFPADHIGESRLRICLYGPPLLHVDLKFVALGDYAGRVEDGIVVWEREPGLVASASTIPAVWPRNDAQWFEDRFWGWVHYTAAKIGRGELFDVLESLAYFRSVVLGPMLAERAGRRPQGVRRLEWYAGDHLAALRRTTGDHTRHGCSAALREVIALYRALRDPDVLRREAAEAASLDFLAEVERASR